MPIIVNLDVVLAQRKMRLNDLAEAVDITPQNLSVLKTGKAKAIASPRWRPSAKHLELPARRIFWNSARATPEKNLASARTEYDGIRTQRFNYIIPLQNSFIYLLHAARSILQRK